jgi:uncharacterized membrane protein YfcA
MLAIILGSLVGLSLGLTGGGGSIFAVPLLVYGLGLEFRQAVAVSLAVVGATALYGGALQARTGHVVWGAGALLGVGGILTAPVGAFMGAQLPASVSLLMFAGLMAVVGVRMLSKDNLLPFSTLACPKDAFGHITFSWSCAMKLFTTGMITGVLSGIFGVGGGFLIVPALLMVAGISLESATGTSLVSIALISLSGFTANFSTLSTGALPIASAFFAGSWIGMAAGSKLKSHLPASVLRRIFGFMIVATVAVLVMLTIGENFFGPE